MLVGGGGLGGISRGLFFSSNVNRLILQPQISATQNNKKSLEHKITVIKEYMHTLITANIPDTADR